jgi:hypothetical protein
MAPRASAVLTGLCLTAVCVLGTGLPASAARPASAIRSTARIPAGLDTPEARLWVSRYDGSGNSGDNAMALGRSPDGTKVFVTGFSTGSTSGSNDITVTYDASTGAQVWAKRYNGPGNGDDYAVALGVSPDGTKVFVTGYSLGSTGNYDYATLAYDASTGAQVWARRYNGPGNGDDDAVALGVSPDGTTVFVTGYSRGSTSGLDYATVAYGASTGADQWVARYNGPGNGNDYAASALGVSPDGTKVFVTGQSLGATGSYEDATVAYAASSGARSWVTRYGGQGNTDNATGLGVSPDGTKVFVTGYGLGSASGFDYGTIAYDVATGARLWVRHYNGPGNGNDYAATIGVTTDGTRVFVTGQSAGPTGSSEYATIAYGASTGAQLWVRRYRGPSSGSTVATALGVSPDGSKVFVTGSTESSSRFAYATVAYDALTGAQLWVKGYTGPGNGNNVATAIGVSPDGTKVFVTGHSLGSTGTYDYATVAYKVT